MGRDWGPRQQSRSCCPSPSQNSGDSCQQARERNHPHSGSAGFLREGSPVKGGGGVDIRKNEYMIYNMTWHMIIKYGPIDKQWWMQYNYIIIIPYGICWWYRSEIGWCICSPVASSVSSAVGGWGERSKVRQGVGQQEAEAGGDSFTPADRNRKAKDKQSWRKDKMRRDKRKMRRNVRKKAKEERTVA